MSFEEKCELAKAIVSQMVESDLRQAYERGMAAERVRGTKAEEDIFHMQKLCEDQGLWSDTAMIMSEFVKQGILEKDE